MELSGITALLFVAVVFVMGILAGMIYTAWVALIKFKQQGYTINEHLIISKLPEAANGTQEG